MKKTTPLSLLLYLLFTVLLFNCAGKRPPVKQPEEEQKIYDSEAIRHFMNGEIYSLHGNYAMAVLEYQDAAKIDSSSSTIYKSIGDAYINLGKYENAKKALLKAVQLDSLNYEARKQLTDIIFFEGDYKDAEKRYKRLSDKLPENLDIDYKLAEIYLRTERIQEALQKYENIFRKDRSQIAALERAAEILFLSKNFNKAAQYYNFLAQLDPENTEYLKTSADLAILNQDIDKAIEIYQKLIKLLPDDEKIQNNFGEILSQVKEDKYNPLNYLKTMVNKHPENIENYKNLAYYYANNNEINSGLEVLLEAQEKFPENADLLFIIGSLYHEKGNPEKALEYLDRALSFTEDTLQIYHLKATILEEAGKYTQSDSLYNYMIDKNPDDPIALNNYAYSLAVRGEKLEMAKDLVNKALKIVPENPSYLDTKGWVLYKQNKYLEAEKYLQKALKAIGENAEILEHLGDVKMKMGKPKEAKKHYQKALELDPDNEILKEKVNQ
ncbi:MAG: tetratricopeptide repeat protein [Fidelibacterota bacterium]